MQTKLPLLVQEICVGSRPSRSELAAQFRSGWRARYHPKKTHRRSTTTPDVWRHQHPHHATLRRYLATCRCSRPPPTPASSVEAAAGRRSWSRSTTIEKRTTARSGETQPAAVWVARGDEATSTTLPVGDTRYLHCGINTSSCESTGSYAVANQAFAYPPPPKKKVPVGFTSVGFNF